MENSITYEKYHISDTQIDTKYCVDNSVRDLNIQSALKRKLPSLQPATEISDEPCAIVGFGTSLHDTWQDILKFKYVFTCSGSLKFLVEKGVNLKQFTKVFHCEIDPRKHKAELIGQPHKEVEYLISSACHPKVFDLLEGYNVKVWHSYDVQNIRELPSIFPAGDLFVMGGSNIGLRAMVLARVLGFRNQHVFGMDYSFPQPNGTIQQHAGNHPNINKKVVEVELEGRKYFTTPVMVHYAREFFHEVSTLSDVNIKLYGIGMLQHWAYIKMFDMMRVAEQSAIAMTIPPTISDYYKEQNKQLHSERQDYGIGGAKHAQVVMELKNSIGAESVLDYGAGKCELAKSLNFPIWSYDPCIEGIDTPPKPADLLINTDVLEHIEPELLDNVLGDIVRCTKKVAYFVIHTGASTKTLPDGRNAHLIQKDADWWRDKIGKYFYVPDNAVISKPPHIHVIAKPKY